MVSKLQDFHKFQDFEVFFLRDHSFKVLVFPKIKISSSLDFEVTEFQDFRISSFLGIVVFKNQGFNIAMFQGFEV
jgi:hypothetical protein